MISQQARIDARHAKEVTMLMRQLDEAREDAANAKACRLQEQEKATAAIEALSMDLHTTRKRLAALRAASGGGGGCEAAVAMHGRLGCQQCTVAIALAHQP